MRIGVDLTGAQSPGCRLRGIGRYSRSLVRALVERGTGHEWFLYLHEGYPADVPPDAALRAMPRGDTFGQSVDRLAARNPDALDLLLVTSPFEILRGYMTPARPVNGPALAAIVYDLIPYLFHDRYLSGWAYRDHYFRNLERLRRYDCLLAISEATRDDTIGLLGIHGDRVANIRGASEPGAFSPPDGPMTEDERRAFARIGIDGPFVFCVSGQDPRKNTAGLIRAFALLPERLRRSHRLVVACVLNENDERGTRGVAEECGIADRLILTNEIDDELLKRLYRRCAVFAFPSLYEGFGLPLLEAIQSGAPVVAGRNSSQVEVVDEAGLLVDVSDPAEIAAGVARILSDDELAGDLRSRGLVRAGVFSWRDVADRALLAIEGAVGMTNRRSMPRVRPRIAVVAPFPPIRSSLAAHAGRLVRELAAHYRVDVYHPEGVVPELVVAHGGVSGFDERLLARNLATRGYRAMITLDDADRGPSLHMVEAGAPTIAVVLDPRSAASVAEPAPVDGSGPAAILIQPPLEPDDPAWSGLTRRYVEMIEEVASRRAGRPIQGGMPRERVA